MLDEVKEISDRLEEKIKELVKSEAWSDRWIAYVMIEKPKGAICIVESELEDLHIFLWYLMGEIERELGRKQLQDIVEEYFKRRVIFEVDLDLDKDGIAPSE